MARVPVVGGHSEAVNIEFEKYYDLDEAIRIIGNTPGVTLCNDNAALQYPMPIIAHHQDDVFVGRIRRDFSQPNSLNLWVVADNLRKGAATNAIEILQKLIATR